ncbi:hypothetical protein LPB140_05555 [Sphingorhabdus lutea]|uniref:LysM domain-containing protein n=2 Tax=Sphingorhabdus lutea TaxID=1913578 RepID=A0A1L3JEY7_9SPHN|nr:hypothetical protein LPB140_05555 [Sphingorhabdus lutea]
MGKGDSRIPAPSSQNKGAGNTAPILKTEEIYERPDLGASVQPNFNPNQVNKNAKIVPASIYIVQAGDGLYAVEAKTGASFADIAAANDLTMPYILKIGQRLQIPAGTYHRVNSGETGIAIARAYGVKWADIVAMNNLQEPFSLRIGQRLKLPNMAALGNGNSDDLSPEQRANAFNINIDDIVTGGEAASVDYEPSTPKNNVSLATPVAKPASFTGLFTWPLRGELLASFGSKGGGKVNDGINIGAAAGTKIAVAAPGTVVYAGNEIAVFGGLVLVDHGSGYVTAYGHLGQISVNRGDRLSAGDILGNVGSTGYVGAPQLHFEIRKDRVPIDPIGKLPKI